MSELLLTRTVDGALRPMDDEGVERIQKIKAGNTVRCEIVQMRNWKFHKKWFVLARFAYDIWSESMPARSYRGMPVRPNFDRFRKELTILSGHGEPVWNIEGEMRMEAKSLRWDRMDEQTFEELYSATIDTILQRILSFRTDLSDEKIRNHVDQVLRFS